MADSVKVTFSNGDIRYYLKTERSMKAVRAGLGYLHHCEIHREDGPAIIYATGEELYVLNNTIYNTFDEWIEKLATFDEEQATMMKLKYG